MNGTKEFKKIPMMRPGIDHRLANAYTYDKDAYEKCFNDEVFQTALKEGKCYLYPYGLWEEAADDYSKYDDMTVYGNPKLNIGHIVSIDRKNNTCDISIRDDTEVCKKAIEALEDKDNTFVYIGVNSTGKIKSLNNKIFEPEAFTTFMLVTVSKDGMDYKKNFASYPVDNTYYADINNNK